MAADAFAVSHEQMVIDRLPGAVIAEPSKPAIDGGRRWEAVGQHLPSTAGAQCVEVRVNDLAHRPLALTSAQAWRRQKWLQDHPFAIGQVTSIAQPHAAMLRAGGRGPDEVFQKGFEHPSGITSRPAIQPSRQPFRHDSEMASKLDFGRSCGIAGEVYQGIQCGAGDFEEVR
jgi:hypothetical protein